MKKLLALSALIAALTFIRADAQVVPAPPGTAAMVCANNSVVPSPTAGNFFYVQCDSNGKLITSGSSGGGGAPSGPAGGGLAGTYPNPTVATNANLTGDVTSSGNATTYNNVVPTAKGGVPQGAFTTFAPSPSCGTAVFTGSTARWQQIAPKTSVVEYDIIVSAIGSCTSLVSNLTLNLPNTANSGSGTTARDFVGGGALVSCNIQIASSATTLFCVSPGTIALATNSRFTFTITYENT